MVKIGQAKLDEFAFVLLAGLIMIIVMLLAWGVPGPREIPVVTPDSVYMDIERGDEESFILKINVTSKKVSLRSAGTIGDWIEFSDNDFEVVGLTNIEVTVDVPRRADEREHDGTIIVESEEGGITEIPVTIDVISPYAEPSEIREEKYFPDITVSFAAGEEILKTERNILVRRGINENKYFKMSARISQDLEFVTGGTISIDILDTNHEGNLIVKVNNEVVYDRSAPSGRIKIPVKKSLLSSYNTVEVSSGSTWKFWTSSFYRMDKIEFSVNLYGGKEHVEYFSVSDDALRNFKSAKLQFEIEDYTGDGNLIIKINDRVIFDGQPHRIFTQDFDAFDVGLVKDRNTLAFSTESGTSYRLNDVKIIITHEI